VLNHTAPDPGPDPVRGAWCGTLFLDNVAALSNGTQRLLLWFARRTLGGSVAPEGAVPVRLATGSPEPLGAASPGTFIPELFDEIDKISIGLDVAAGAA
jgi:DNA-binding NtrC family response regulator